MTEWSKYIKHIRWENTEYSHTEAFTKAFLQDAKKLIKILLECCNVNLATKVCDIPAPYPTLSLSIDYPIYVLKFFKGILCLLEKCCLLNISKFCKEFMCFDDIGLVSDRLGSSGNIELSHFLDLLSEGSPETFSRFISRITCKEKKELCFFGLGVLWLSLIHI